MKTRLTFLNTRANCEIGQTAHKTVLKLGMGFGAESLIQQLIDKVDTLEESNQDLLQSNANLIERVEALEEGDGFPIKVNMVVMVNQAVTDMSAFMGYGIWARVCVGRSPMGSGFTTDARGESIMFTVGETGGRYKHALAPAENAPHTHSFKPMNWRHGKDGQWTDVAGWAGGNVNNVVNVTPSNNETMFEPSGGQSTPHENTHPFQVFEIWQRTA